MTEVRQAKVRAWVVDPKVSVSGIKPSHGVLPRFEHTAVPRQSLQRNLSVFNVGFNHRRKHLRIQRGTVVNPISRF